ncbi:hypothetical protein GUJ93_ZPchr0010g10124 [Zizania palustris]|uniref:Uncharacterized protein n=1 Tax=Zizania palustris TaxID=103762 RepID=A0A8J5WCS0_ZIZPA|nr:hypothetical protein GUJ93_ZPchr0010g10124 [Zizania palustris]
MRIFDALRISATAPHGGGVASSVAGNSLALAGWVIGFHTAAESSLAPLTSDLEAAARRRLRQSGQLGWERSQASTQSGWKQWPHGGRAFTFSPATSALMHMEHCAAWSSSRPPPAPFPAGA